MNEEIAQEILQELISSLEALETQTGAILQFLNDKGLAQKSEIAPYLEQEGQAASIRWRAARARIDRLVSSLMNSTEESSENKAPKSKEGDQGKESDPEKKASPEADKAGRGESGTKDTKEQEEQENKTAGEPTPGGKPEPEKVHASAGQDSVGPHREGNEERKTDADADKTGRDTNEKAA